MVSKFPRQGSSALPPVGEELDEDAQLEREMTIEGAKLGPHTSPHEEDDMLVDESETRPIAMEIMPPQVVANQAPAPHGGRVSPSMTQDTIPNPEKPRGHGGPEGPEAMQEDDDEEALHPPAEGGEVDADEITAKLIFHYPFELEPQNRHTFNEGALLSELNAQSAIIGGDFPLFTKGVVRVPKGQPASVLLPSEDLADRFIAHTETLVVDAKSRDGKECLVTLM
ncbi:MAG: hypothetical protein SGPRY_005340, partial [Prymnesium sp.]